MSISSEEYIETLKRGDIVKDKYKVTGQIGFGSFGELYEAHSLETKGLFVAIKIEKEKVAHTKALNFELCVLQKLQGLPHICKVYDYGRMEGYSYIVMDLQGSNLCVLRRNLSRRVFSLSTTVRLAVQMLQAIKDVHDRGFVHRDIKPSNFAIGRQKTQSGKVYLLDFGLARIYRNSYGMIIRPRRKVGFRGTIRYASPNAHDGEELGRHDDLYSLFYAIIEFLNGRLPWRSVNDKEEVGRMKKSIDVDHLLKNLPHQLIGFYEHLMTLDYFTDPDYSFLFSCLHSIIHEYEIDDDEPFDWVFSLNSNDIRSRSKSMEKKDYWPCKPRSQSKSRKQLVKVEDYESENAITKYTDASAHTEDIMIDQFQTFLDEDFEGNEQEQIDKEFNDPPTVNQSPEGTVFVE